MRPNTRPLQTRRPQRRCKRLSVSYRDVFVAALASPRIKPARLQPFAALLFANITPRLSLRCLPDRYSIQPHRSGCAAYFPQGVELREPQFKRTPAEPGV